MKFRVGHVVCTMLLLLYYATTASAQQTDSSRTGISPLQSTARFDPVQFYHPQRVYGPFTRWWWPGNDVHADELRREIKLFADNGFAGVEIQPLTMGINPDAAKERLDKVYSWDSPAFYSNLRAVMEQARVSGITVDLNGGSGWPIGGPWLKPSESMLTLTYSDTVIAGGSSVVIPVPKHLPDYASVVIFDTLHLYKKVAGDEATLQAVTAAKLLEKRAGQYVADPATARIITGHVQQNTLRYTLPPGGEWIITAYWSVPDGQVPTLIASRDPGLVANHFDSLQVQRSFEYLLGQRTGLRPFYSNPLRAIFNDSYEFRSDRHYSNDFIPYFRKHRGYDITPWMGAVLERGYNNNAAPLIYPGAKPPYVFSGEDWRLRYDYDQTVGELLQQHFIQAGNHWMGNFGMQHRTQPYGVKTDVIAAAGSADIPEAEQLFARGSEGCIKLITSGAHLYNRPIITQESFVFMSRSEMTTPQKIRFFADKAFTCGINQVIYSGSSYQYLTPDYGPEGWNTWSTPYSGFDFSSNINESYTWWNDIRNINAYITRSQYLLQSGRAVADVLVYFPFIDFTQEDLVENPEELGVTGYMEGVEPFAPSAKNTGLNDKEQWFAQTWNIINILNAHGITWDWVNDGSLREATAVAGGIDIRGNQYKALVIPFAPYMQLQTALTVTAMAKKTVPVLFVGDTPDQQPGFFDYEKRDAITRNAIQESLRYSNCKQIADTIALNNWATTIPLQFTWISGCRQLRTINRMLQDSSLLKMIWNPTLQDQTISLNVNPAYPFLYWLDAAEATITTAEQNNSTITTTLSPQTAIFLYAFKKPLALELLKQQPESGKQQQEFVLDKWGIQAGWYKLQDTTLFEWTTDARFRYMADTAYYTTSFLPDKKQDKRYVLDLGKLYFTASITVNGHQVNNLLWSPYTADITNYLQQGTNSITVAVVPSKRNSFILKAMQGDPLYKQFRGMENAVLPGGLVGPVKLVAYDQR